MPKKVFIRTLGCPKNEADSEHIRGMLERDGYEQVASPDTADVVVVNTCAFVEAARRESVDAILDEVSTRAPGQAVVVAGCMVERYGKELADELPEVDAFMSLGSYGRTVEIVGKALDGVRQLCLDAGKVPLSDLPRGTPNGPTAFVKISEGCDRVCSFCAIPAIRGGHRSRSPIAVVGEARWLASLGVKEVVLVGQDMSLYGRDTERQWMLPDLIRRVGSVEGLRWVRTLYHYPQYVNDELLDAVADAPAAVPYFDLSLQHASGRLVRRMRRWGDGERFLALIDKVRDRLPGAVLRSAFIVGFPGETEADVAELADFLRAARIDWAGFFPYSPEEGTEAHGFSRRVSRRVATERAEALSRIQEEVAEAKRAELIGERVEVLVESRRGHVAHGRTWREAPDVDGAVRLTGAKGARVGDLVSAKVTALDGLDLLARA